MDLKEKIRNIPDFPIPGVLFRDITTLLKDGEAYHALIDALVASLGEEKVDLVIGPEARGFVIGSALAYALGAGFVIARKPGKLPCKTMRYEYGLEYGSDALEIHEDAIRPGQRVVIVDDLLEKKPDLFERFPKIPTFWRWSVYYGLIVFIIVFGAYGAGYQTVDLIYAGF